MRRNVLDLGHFIQKIPYLTLTFDLEMTLSILNIREILVLLEFDHYAIYEQNTVLNPRYMRRNVLNLGHFIQKIPYLTLTFDLEMTLIMVNVLNEDVSISYDLYV